VATCSIPAGATNSTDGGDLVLFAAVWQQCSESVEGRFGVIRPLRGSPGDHRVVCQCSACAPVHCRAPKRTHNRKGRGPLPRDQHPDFRSHLQGRIAWASAENEARAAKLQHAFALIDW